jgi:mRNA interferase MazF
VKVIKRFIEWIQVKIKLHGQETPPFFVSEGEIWWASVGDNIGREINGKGDYFTRPVYIYQKLNMDFHLVIPMTSKIKHGPWFVAVTHNEKEVFLCMNQIRTIDSKRLRDKLGQMGDLDRLRIYYSFLSLYGSKIKNSN